MLLGQRVRVVVLISFLASSALTAQTGYFGELQSLLDKTSLVL